MTTRELQVGDRVRDNEYLSGQPMGNGIVLVIEKDGYAHVRQGVFSYLVPLSRIHLDEKPRKTGWSRVG